MASDFLKPSFDVSAWVNAALASGAEGQSVEERASSHLLTLQMRHMELSGLMEEASFEAAGSIPKVLRELERIRDESDDLKSKLQGIELSLGGIEATTERSVALLMELDRVKRNMQQCATALSQAERFAALSKQIEGALAEGQDFGAVVGQMREVRTSLHVLQDVPEFRNATARLAQYEKRLELQLRPRFVAAVRANEVQTALELSGVYRDIQQEAVMKTAYFETRLEDLQAFVNAQAQAPIAGWLPLFYSRLLTIVTAEAEWCQRLFGRERKREMQAELSSHMLEHFARTLASRMEGLTLVAAVELHRHAEAAATHLDPSVERALEAPFAQVQSSYGQLERDTLLAAMRTPNADAFALAEAAVDRCQSLTKFAQLKGLISALEALFAPPPASAAVPGNVIASRAPSAVAGGSNPLPKSAPSSTTSKPGDQWAPVQAALQSLWAAKASHRRLGAFDSRLRARILAVVAHEEFANDAGRAVLPLAEQHARSAIEAARAVVFDAIFGVVRSSFADLAKQPVWTRVVTDVDPDMPKMRPDASPAVTRVIEHLFALPHHLENLDDPEDGAEHWINVVAKAAVDLFSKEIQTIPKLSAAGALQLQTDVDALANLLSALGVQKKIRAGEVQM
jgi:cell fate (sporulation/competence/biofilm development) regulator YlbF (YheA/YmcA/DUF963 family)